jgi:MFS family permease/acyl carrier protein
MTEPLTETDQRIAALSPEQRELLLRRLRERTAPVPAAVPAAPEIPSLVDDPFDPHQPMPLSDIQAAFWMGGSGLYDLGGSSANVYVEYEFAGLADGLAARLNPVIARTVACHPMLRTVVSAGGMQRVLAEPPSYEVELVDLSRLSDDEAERHLESTRERLRYSRHPSDRWPLFDMVVFQLSGELIRFQARFDAMLVDGTSRALLIDELIRGVLSEPAGAPSEPQPALEITYFDFLRALQAFRDSATWERCRAYWLTRLPSLPSAPRLPLARDFGPETVPRIVWRNVTLLPPAPWAALCRRAAQRGITPSGIGTALLAETLRAWSEEPSFTLGLSGAYYPPVHPQIRQVIGTFTNLYLLEAEEAPGPFATRARRLQDRLNADLDHQHFSGHEVLRELNRTRRAGGRATLPVHFTSLLRSAAPSPDEEPEAAPPQSQPQEIAIQQIDLMIAMPQVLLFWVLGETLDRSLSLISQAVEELFPPDLVTDLIDGYRRLAVRLAEDDAAWSEAKPLRLPAAAPPDGAGSDTDAIEAGAGELARLSGLGPADRLLALSPPGSSLALCEARAARDTGATLIVPEDWAPEALADLATAEQITVWSSAPALFEAVLHHLEKGRRPAPRSRRRVLLHRDRIPAGLPARLQALGGDVQAFATWGTAEAPIAAAGPLDADGTPALRAAAGRHLEVLDRDLMPRPTWVPGDLYVGGAATGERARRLPDDRIEILGNEPVPPVEALGYGADPRRIEAALQRHPAVRHAVVAWRGTEQRLVAWLVLRSGPEPSDGALRDHLRAMFPEHLVPPVFVRLHELPLTVEGLIDRAALAIPAVPRPHEEPSWGPLLTELAGLWEEMLGQRPASPEDDFFTLGGDSLLATRLMGRLAERFGLERPLPSFLKQPTLACLAELVNHARAERVERLKLRPFQRLRDSLAALRDRLLPPPTSPAYGMRTFLTLWFGQLVSAFGTGLGSFTLGVWIFERTNSTTQFAMTGFTATVTMLLLTPIAGSLADRRDRRRLLILGDLGSGVTTLIMATLLFTGLMRPWHVYPIVVLMVGFTALQGPALSSSVSLLVSRSQLARASGMSQMSRAVAQIIGPLAAGVLVGKIGYSGVILIDCSTFLFAVFTILLVRIPSPPRRQEVRSSPLSDLRYGWEYLRGLPGLFALLSLYAVTNFCMGMVQVLLTPLVLSFATPVELGTVNSAGAAGVVLGGLTLTLWGGPRRRVLGIFVFLVVQCLLLVLGGIQPSIPLITLATCAFMFTVPIAAACNQAILQSKVAADVQGRVFAVAGMIAAGSAPVASLVAGPLADRVFGPLLQIGGPLADTAVGRLIGVGPGRGMGLMFICLALLVLFAVGFAFLNPRLQQLESEDAEASGEPTVPAPTQV